MGRTKPRPQQPRRHAGDAIRAAVGIRAGGHDNGVEQVVPDPVPEPVQEADVVVIDRAGELDLDGFYLTSGPPPALHLVHCYGSSC